MVQVQIGILAMIGLFLLVIGLHRQKGTFSFYSMRLDVFPVPVMAVVLL